VAILEDASAPPLITSLTNGPTLTSAAFSPPAGSLLVAIAAAGYGGTLVPTIAFSDSAGGTWTVPATTGANLGRTSIAIRYLAAGATNLTVTATFAQTTGNVLLGVKVLTGAAATQTGAAVGTYAPAGTTTVGTFPIVTTQAESQVVGCSINNTSSAALTLDAGSTGYTPVLTDATNGGYVVAWRRTAATTTPGSTTVGGTWAAAVRNLGAALEVLPAGVTRPRPIGPRTVPRRRAANW
jgi:hypothetical protein